MLCDVKKNKKNSNIKSFSKTNTIHKNFNKNKKNNTQDNIPRGPLPPLLPVPVIRDIKKKKNEPTFDMISNNLWTRYTELTSVEEATNLREECDKLLLTANEIERIREEEETKERVKQIDAELTRLHSQTTLSRKLDFDFVVDNLFEEFGRLPFVLLLVSLIELISIFIPFISILDKFRICELSLLDLVLIVLFVKASL